jgi:dipeptidyl aminopeptidase/acylaminoacyl peptidase
VRLPDGDLRQVAAPKGWYLTLNVSPDGNSVAYRAPELDGPIPHDLFIQPLRGGPAINLTASRINNRVDAFVWKSGNSFLALGQHGFANRLYEISGNGPPQKVDAAADDTTAFDARAGVLALVRQSWTERPELWVSVDGRPPRQATNLNKEWRNIHLIAPRYLHFRSFDGTEIEAALLVPATYRKGAMLPTVVMLHGGPAGRWGNPPHAWGYPTGQVLAARGYAVLYPNVRGSSGYGQKFMEMNRGHLGGGDFKDVMAAVDYVIHDGIADPDRLGVAGWSYGGYLTMWAVTQTNRFKAAVAGAGWSNWMNEFGTDDVPHIDAWWFPEPYKHPEAFVRSSPIAHVANVRTPILMLHGDADRRDPLGESQQFYRALKWLGIETRLFVYPGEGHPFRQGPHMIDSIDRTLAWFDSHMKHQALHQETDFYVGDKAGK